jgi:purine-binding chemotaxis protein CheW
MDSPVDNGRQLCTFVLDGHLIGIDVAIVHEVVRGQRITPVPLAPSVVAGLINLRGQIITAIDLRGRLGLSERPAEELPIQVMVSIQGTTLCLLVDRLGDVVELPKEHPAPAPETLSETMRSLIPAAYPLDGQLLLLLDCERVARLSAEV